MRTRKLLFAALLCVSFAVNAQENKSSISYSNITEFGFIVTSPNGMGYEATSVNGLAINGRHCIGLGVGVGFLLNDFFGGPHLPIFANYRLYFKSENKVLPHINIALGGLMIDEGGGLYSSVTSGFKYKKFSLSAGFSFMLIRSDMRYNIYYGYDDYYDYDYGYGYGYSTSPEYSFPWGVTLKFGFTF